MNKKIALFFLIFSILFSSWCFKKEVKDDTKNEVSKKQETNLEAPKKTQKEIYDFLVSYPYNTNDETRQKYYISLKEWNYKDSINNFSSLYEQSKKDKSNLTYLWDAIYLVESYVLDSSFSTWSTSSLEKASSLLWSLWLWENNWFYNYYLWLIKKQQWDYDNALSHYNKSLDYFKENNNYLSTVNSSIWDLYSVKWESEKAYDFYRKSYEQNNKNSIASLNISKYLISIGLLEQALPYLKYSLDIEKNKYVLSDVNYFISYLYLISWQEWSLKNAYYYAWESIKYNPNSYLWYLSKWILTFHKWPDFFDESISILEKSNSLKENSSSYYYLWEIYYSKWEIQKAINMYEKWLLFDSLSNPSNKIMSDIYFSLSISYSLLNNKENSFENIEKALKEWQILVIYSIYKEIEKQNSLYKNLVWYEKYDNFVNSYLDSKK